MGLASALQKKGDGNATDRSSGDPSVSSSLEHLISGSQGVITKRVDLALLEAQEMMTRFIGRAALGGVAILLASGAWFAVAGALVLLLMPTANASLQLFVFGLINAAGTLGLVRAVQRSGVPIATADRNATGAAAAPGSSRPETGN